MDTDLKILGPVTDLPWGFVDQICDADRRGRNANSARTLSAQVIAVVVEED
jgi:hypothetical protein